MDLPVSKEQVTIVVTDQQNSNPKQNKLDSLASTHVLHQLCIIIKDTHDWNYDKPYKWGLEALTGKTFVKNKFF